MSFTLKKIELNNIRAHEHLIFEPALEGVTAISGDNGSGKSTIVDAFAWGLYGTRPSGIRNKNLIREGVNPKDDLVSVKSTLIIGGVEYLIERKIINAQGTVECNVWGKQKDGKKLTQLAGPSVSHVEKFIRNELGMNEKGFLTSVFIQQKQVDQIVSATPRERGAVIEEMTGIASITQAISKTNENTRALEKAISIFQIGNLEEVQEKVDKQKDICNQLKDRKKIAVDKFNNIKKSYKNLKEDLDKQQKLVDKRIKLTQTLEGLKEQITFLKKQAEDDLKYIDDFKSKYGTTIHVDVTKSRKVAEDKRNEIYVLKTQIENLQKELITNKEDIDKCIVLKGSFTTNKEITKELNKVNKELLEKQKNLDDKINNQAMIISELKHSEEAYKHIDGKNKNCPVCKSNIKDPAELKMEIKKDIDNYKKDKKEIKKEIEEITSTIKDLEDEQKNITIASEAIKEENKLIKRQKEINTQIKIISDKRDLKNVELKVLESEYEKALKIETDKNALKSAKARSLTVNKRIDETQNKIKTIEKQIKNLNALSDRSLNALITKTKNTENKLTKMSIAGKELIGRDKLEQERLEDALNNLKQVQNTMKQYDKIAKEIEISSAAATLLSAFKADRIEYSIPTLEFYASDFLSKFTGGAFTRLTLDEKFNTFVTTSSGHVRPVAQLSGGELSAAAISLRLGIAMLLNSSKNNVLILDEVLVSMDEDRARQIMETISSMTNSQIIFIAHNSDINSIADKTILISKNNTESGG